MKHILRSPHRAFTLVELLVVIAIIGILVSLLLPAVQSAREAARLTQCKNNLHQLATAFHTHHTAHMAYPSGGWGFYWVGDPDRASDENQPGSWMYSLLPHLEQMNLHQLGADGDSENITAAQKTGATEREQTPLVVTACPTRRKPGTIPPYYYATWPGYNMNTTPKLSRSDYAANAGDYQVGNCEADNGPTSIAQAKSGYAWWDMKNVTGIVYQRSHIGSGAIRDGLSNTYMVGEKYVNANEYLSGSDRGDNEGMYAGFANNSTRFSAGIPLRDRAGSEQFCSWGSAHPAGFQMAMCDGSIKLIRFTIDLSIHQRLANRRDNLPIPADAW